MPYNKNQWSRYSPDTSPPVVPPTLPQVTIHEHCDGSGWSHQLKGPGVFTRGTENNNNTYRSDVSYIKVPAGLTVVISTNGRSFIIVGPYNFNACGGSGDWFFNDNIARIEIRDTASTDVTGAVTPPPAPTQDIIIESATYGGNCRTTQNNVKNILQNIINRQTDKTSYRINGGLNGVFGDPAPGCPKDFSVVYKASNGNRVTKYFPAIVNETYEVRL